MDDRDQTEAATMAANLVKAVLPKVRFDRATVQTTTEEIREPRRVIRRERVTILLRTSLAPPKKGDVEKRSDRHVEGEKNSERRNPTRIGRFTRWFLGTVREVLEHEVVKTILLLLVSGAITLASALATIYKLYF